MLNLGIIFQVQSIFIIIFHPLVYKLKPCRVLDFFNQKVFADLHPALYVKEHSEEVIILPQDIENNLLLSLSWPSNH